jgi:hypothetical protein
MYAGVRMIQIEKDVTTLLYALSTLAQTSAALAAFVGAVGIYHLQTLGWTARAIYEDISAIQGRPPLTSAALLDVARGLVTRTIPKQWS